MKSDWGPNKDEKQASKQNEASQGGARATVA